MRSGESLVALVVIGIDRGVLIAVVGHEALQGLLVSVFDHRGAHKVGVPVLCADHGHLPNRTTACVEAFRLVLVLLLAADVCLVSLDWANERFHRVVPPCLPNPVRQVPGGLLSNLELAVQLHARDTLDVGGQEVERDGPYPKPQVRTLHERSRLSREALAAVAAAVGLRFTGSHRGDVDRAT